MKQLDLDKDVSEYPRHAPARPSAISHQPSLIPVKRPLGRAGDFD
jgi:hypothetical protein